MQEEDGGVQTGGGVTDELSTPERKRDDITDDIAGQVHESRVVQVFCCYLSVFGVRRWPGRAGVERCHWWRSCSSKSHH